MSPQVSGWYILEQRIMSSRAEELLEHEVVGVLPLIKEHWRCEAHWANKEGQPATQNKRKRRYIICEWKYKYWQMIWTRVFLPEARSGCVRWRLPAQTLGEKLRESRGGGPGSRCRGRPCARGMVRAALTYRRTHAQFHQEAKQLGKSSAKSGRSCGNTSKKKNKNRIDYI